MLDRITTSALHGLAKLTRRTFRRIARRSMRGELMLLAAGVDVDQLRREDRRNGVAGWDRASAPHAA